MRTYPSEVTQAAEATQEEQTELVKTGSMELQYAENFAVDYYEDGYKMLTTLPDSKRYLIVPEGQPVPRGLDEDVSILQEPLQNIYLVASAAWVTSDGTSDDVSVEAEEGLPQPLSPSSPIRSRTYIHFLLFLPDLKVFMPFIACNI